MATRHHLWKPGQSGNPSGRAKGMLGHKTKEAMAVFEEFRFCTLTEQIKLIKTIQHRAKHCDDPELRFEYEKAILTTLSWLTRYQYAQVSAIKVTGDMTMVHQLAMVDTMSDSELAQHIRTLRQRQQEDAQVLDVTPLALAEARAMREMADEREDDPDANG